MGKNQSVNAPYPLILASTSKYRGALLAQLGWEFTSEDSKLDESPFKNQNHSPKKLAQILARAKAEAVFKKKPHSCVIGSDQVCSFEEHILSKPQTKENAIKQLTLMQGKSHNLFTAVSVLSPKGETQFINTTTLHMRKMNHAEIQRYVEADLPLDCAGSYKLESGGIKLFHKIEMTDQTSIIGLPLIELTTTLLQLGYSL